MATQATAIDTGPGMVPEAGSICTVVEHTMHTQDTNTIPLPKPEPARLKLVQSRYNPGRGGHAPGDLRDAFCEVLEALVGLEDGAPMPTVEVREQVVPATEILRTLWNCPDQVPSVFWSDVEELCGDSEDMPKRRTYGAVARAVLAVFSGED